MVLLAGDHLRGRVARRTASSLQLLAVTRLVHVAQTEVNYFQRLVKVEQQILWLQVAMANATLVNVFNTGYKLLVKSNSGLFVQPLVADDVVKQLTVLAELHN